MSSELELRHCRAFIAVIDHGGPTKAAAMLGIAQSTLSEALLALERSIGAKVFVPGRTAPGKPRALTPAGEALLPHARRLVALVEDAVRDTQHAASKESFPEGTLSLGAPESVTAYLLPRITGRLLNLWPRMALEVTVGLCDELRLGVSKGALDLALIIEPDAEAAATGSGLRVETLAPARMAVVAATTMAGTNQPVTRRDLARMTLITSDPSGALRRVLHEYLGGLAVNPHIRSAGSVDAVKRALDHESHEHTSSPASAGAFVGVLPAHAIQDDIARGTLRDLPLITPVPAVFLKAVTRRDRELSPVGQALLADLRGIDLRFL